MADQIDRQVYEAETLAGFLRTAPATGELPDYLYALTNAMIAARPEPVAAAPVGLPIVVHVLDGKATLSIDHGPAQAVGRGDSITYDPVAARTEGLTVAPLVASSTTEPVVGTYDHRDNAGPWAHRDGSPCKTFWSDKPHAPGGRDWWCTEHSQYVRPAVLLATWADHARLREGVDMFDGQFADARDEFLDRWGRCRRCNCDARRCADLPASCCDACHHPLTGDSHG